MSREMKHSGIEWIGKIPKEWNSCRLKGVAHSMTKGNGITKEEVFPDGDVSCVRYGEIYSKYNGSFKTCFSKTRKDILPIVRYFDYGDILFAGTGELVEEIGKNIVYLGESSCLAGGDIIILKHGQNPIFLNYALNSHYIQSQKSCGKAKLKVVHISSSEIGDIKVVLPPLSEQQKIADFLDKLCGEVDEMIALQEQMIEELKAYRQSVITEAVTKGLYPEAPMKDSGINRIGNIPEEWQVVKMNHICSVITDFVASGSFESLRVNVPYLDSPDYAMLVRTVDLSGNSRSSSKVYISMHSYNFLHNSNLFGGEIVLPNIGASVGDVYIVPKLYERMSLAPNAIMFKTTLCDKYYFYFFCSTVGKESIYDISQSTAQAKFNKTELREIRVLAPPLSEQQAIASFLDGKCAEINSLIVIKQQKIEELKEYKKSIIYEYVTGKKEVV